MTTTTTYFKLLALAENIQQLSNHLDHLHHHVFSEMSDVRGDITYILYHHYHPQNFDYIHDDVIAYLKKNGLRENSTTNKDEKANPDYYLAAYFGLETVEYYFNNCESMDFYEQLNQLTYAKSQLAILEALSSTGEPKRKYKNTKGQSKGANIRNRNEYKCSRKIAQQEWEKYKKNIPEWDT